MTHETQKRLAIVAEGLARREGYEKGLDEVIEVRRQNDILKTALQISINHSNHGLSCVICLTAARAIATVEGKLLQICMWCQVLIETVPCEPKMVGEVSHGLCVACYEKQAKGLKS